MDNEIMNKSLSSDPYLKKLQSSSRERNRMILQGSSPTPSSNDNNIIGKNYIPMNLPMMIPELDPNRLSCVLEGTNQMVSDGGLYVNSSFELRKSLRFVNFKLKFKFKMLIDPNKTEFKSFYPVYSKLLSFKPKYGKSFMPLFIIKGDTLECRLECFLNRKHNISWTQV